MDMFALAFCYEVCCFLEAHVHADISTRASLIPPPPLQFKKFSLMKCGVLDIGQASGGCKFVSVFDNGDREC